MISLMLVNKGENLMFVELINATIDQLVDLVYTQYEKNGSYISLENVKKYVRFYFWVKHLQSLEPTYSITDVNKMIIKDMGLEERFYLNGQPTCAMDSYNERGTHQYHKINPRTQKEEKLRSEKIKNMSGNCCKNRRIDLKKSQIHQYKIHRHIKDKGDYLREGNSDAELEKLSTTITRISKYPKNNSLLSFKRLYEYYISRTDDPDVISKSLEYYHLEISLNYNLLVSILVHVSKNCHSEEKALESISDLQFLFLNPLVDQRQKYVELYFELDDEKKKNFVNELVELNRFIYDSIAFVFKNEFINDFLNLGKNLLNYNVITGYYELHDFEVSYKKTECNLDYYKLILDRIIDLNDKLSEI